MFLQFWEACKPIVLGKLRAAYRVVGEGYIHGFIDGEMKGTVDGGEYQVQEITMC